MAETHTSQQKCEFRPERQTKLPALSRFEPTKPPERPFVRFYYKIRPTYPQTPSFPRKQAKQRDSRVRGYIEELLESAVKSETRRGWNDNKALQNPPFFHDP